jgi:hypothetical protein
MAKDPKQLSEDQARICHKIYRRALIRASAVVAVTLTLSVVPYFYGYIPLAVSELILIFGAGIACLTYIAFIFTQSRLARCLNCRSAYSKELIDKDETLVAIVPRQQIKRVAEASSTEGERYETSSWTEERYSVTDSYECRLCGDETKVKYFKTRKTGYRSSGR